MFTSELPSNGHVCIDGRDYHWSVTFTPDKWWVVSLRHTLFGDDRLACGKGRSAKVALKFAIQALRREIRAHAR